MNKSLSFSGSVLLLVTVEALSCAATPCGVVSFPMKVAQSTAQPQKAMAPASEWAMVRFNANGGTVSESGREVNLNAPIGELPIPERLGYIFKGWYTAKVKGAKVSATTKVTKTMTVYAQWTPKKYWVYTPNVGKKSGTINTGGGMKMTNMGKHAVGSKVTIKVLPANKNYVFDHWEFGADYAFIPKKWIASPDGSEFDSITFVMPPDDVLIEGYGMRKKEDFAPRFTIDCGGTWYVEDRSSIRISIDSGSFPKLNANKSVPAGMKLVRVPECGYGYQCEYVLKVTDWSKLPKGTIKTVKLTATNRSGKKTTKSFKIVMPNRTQAVDKGVLELNTSTAEMYELKAGVKFSWNDLGIAVADGWKITAITGIPGLKWDAAKQKMTGVPSKAGNFAATFTVAKGKTSYVATATFVVEALPKVVVGTFYGYAKGADGAYEAEDGLWAIDYCIGRHARKVTVTAASNGKITAKVGSVSLTATGWTIDEGGRYSVEIRSRKETKTAVKLDQIEITIDPHVSVYGDALTGLYGTGGWSKKGPPTGALEPFPIVARKNAAATDADAKAIAAKYAKLGKQGLVVRKASSADGYAYNLFCPLCIVGGGSPTAFVKVDKSGKVTLSGKIAGVKVSGTAYLTYEYVEEGQLKVFARFFSGKFIIEIEGDTEYFSNNGSLFGRVWKK